MKKTIINTQDSFCVFCKEGRAMLSGTSIICDHCGIEGGLINEEQGKPFEPIFSAARTYRASKYTPPMPDRRIDNKPYPLIRERRMSIARS